MIVHFIRSRAINQQFPFLRADASRGMPTLDPSEMCSPFARSLADKMEAMSQNKSQTLLEQYSSTFYSKRSMVSANRRTISDISMDIIKQRMENINKIASLNRSMNRSSHLSRADHLAQIDEPETISSDKTSPPEADKSKPLKRKLFAPPPDNPLDKLNMKMGKRRQRDDLAMESTGRKPLDKRARQPDVASTSTPGTKKIVKSRRSTMLFQSAEKHKPSAQSKIGGNNNPETPKPVMVFTNMHTKQTEVVREVR